MSLSKLAVGGGGGGSSKGTQLTLSAGLMEQRILECRFCRKAKGVQGRGTWLNSCHPQCGAAVGGNDGMLDVVIVLNGFDGAYSPVHCHRCYEPLGFMHKTSDHEEDFYCGRRCIEDKKLQKVEVDPSIDKADEQDLRKIHDDTILLHERRCRVLGLDPNVTPVVDISGHYYLDVNPIQWKAIDPNDPSLPPGLKRMLDGNKAMEMNHSGLQEVVAEAVGNINKPSDTGIRNQDDEGVSKKTSENGDEHFLSIEAELDISFASIEDDEFTVPASSSSQPNVSNYVESLESSQM